MTTRTPAYDRILAANARSAAALGDRGGDALPGPSLAVLTCMDARIDPVTALGLRPGEAHVIRNAGALATDDALRSLVISQHLLGTVEVLVIGHTDCGMQRFDDGTVRDELARETGAEVELPLLPFADLEASVARQVEAVRRHPWTKDVPVRGLLYEVETGRLREVG
jgi:carbonic anhydrase